MSARPSNLAIPGNLVTDPTLPDTQIATLEAGSENPVLLDNGTPGIKRPSRNIITPDLVTAASRALDVLLIMLSGYLAAVLLHLPFNEPVYWLGFILLFNASLLLTRFLPTSGKLGSRFDQHAVRKLGTLLLGTILVISAIFHLIPITSTQIFYWAVTTCLLCLPALVLGQFIYSLLLAHARNQGLLQWNIALCGINSASMKYLLEHSNNPIGWNRIEGIFSDTRKSPDTSEPSARSRSNLGTTTDLELAIRQGKIDEVIVFPDDMHPQKRHEILDTLSTLPVKISLHYEINNKWLQKHPSQSHRDQHLLELTNSPLHGCKHMVKRGSDIIFSVAGLLLVAPVMAIIALLIKLDSPGPVFFIQPRYGFNNHIIRVFKFRSMYHDTGHNRKFVQTKKNDHRITRIGKFIRKTSLDELPQLFNVLLGEMSMVGPRPHAVSMDDEYKNQIKDFNARYTVVPGITGWAQINGARGETPDIKSMERRFALDRHYIANWSIWLDIKILFLTATRIWNDRQAY